MFCTVPLSDGNLFPISTPHLKQSTMYLHWPKDLTKIYFVQGAS